MSKEAAKDCVHGGFDRRHKLFEHHLGEISQLFCYTFPSKENVWYIEATNKHGGINERLQERHQDGTTLRAIQLYFRFVTALKIFHYVTSSTTVEISTA